MPNTTFMKKQFFILLFIAAALLSLTACKKDVNPVADGGGEQDPLLLGKSGWYSLSYRTFDNAGVEYEGADPFYYGGEDVWYNYLQGAPFIQMAMVLMLLDMEVQRTVS